MNIQEQMLFIRGIIMSDEEKRTTILGSLAIIGIFIIIFNVVQCTEMSYKGMHELSIKQEELKAQTDQTLYRSLAGIEKMNQEQIDKFQELLGAPKDEQ